MVAQTMGQLFRRSSRVCPPNRRVPEGRKDCHFGRDRFASYAGRMYTVCMFGLAEPMKGNQMKNRISALFTFFTVLTYSLAAWAGSSSGGGPAGEAGGGGSEPALYALVILSLIPGAYFIKKARAAQTVAIRKDR